MKRYLWIIILLVFFLTPGVRADDLSIYGTTSISVNPNVLIIFDSSGSMSTDIPSDPYDPSHVYYDVNHGTYTTNAVYERERVRQDNHWVYVYTQIVSDYHDINCSDAKADLESKGYSTQGVYLDYYSNSYECASHGHSQLYLGNWLNYDIYSGDTRSTRIQVAKDVITHLIDVTPDVNFGLMVFNNTQGGRVLAGCGAEDSTTLKNTINALQPGGYTPLAETLAEAGLYFANKKSWYNDTDNNYSLNCDKNGEGCYQYSSPITSALPCQKNYVIIMTDGEPTYDGDYNTDTGTINKIGNTPYINDLVIGDYDKDGVDPNYNSSMGSDYLDDVAKFLYDNDLRTDVGGGNGSFEKQNVVVYTIGFTTQQQLLSDTATEGGGKYYTANSYSGLTAAFEDILSQIADVNGVFVSPVVPVSRMNGTYAGNSLYVGFFKPNADGRWDGNIKKYGINALGDIVDVEPKAATQQDTGTIVDNAQSYWSTSPDGPDVDSGGIGGVLQNQTTRYLYTYIASPPSAASPSADLTNSINAFSTSNSELSHDALGAADDTEKNSVINDIYGAGREWKMGDILHSKPAVVYYDTNNNNGLDEGDDGFIFAGGNDGMMHCFRDSDGREMWGFIPPDLLSKLKDLSDPNITTHEYFVDGSPKIYDEGITGTKVLFFGERRGGNHYYALDITNYDSPQYLYQIGSTFLSTTDGNNNGTADGSEVGGGSTELGQSWSDPTIHKIRTSSTDSENVFLLAGGYDNNQDKPIYVLDPMDPDPDMSPYRAEEDNQGKAVFTVNVLTGAVGKLNINAGYYPQMTHSIVDVSGFDSNGDGYTNRVYAGDLGGNVFAFEDDGTGNWSYRKFFSAPVETYVTSTIRRKIFYAPDAVEETYGEIIFFGTGDRADPDGSNMPQGFTLQNRIYAIQNHWESMDTFQTLTEDDLYDATDDAIAVGTLEQQQLARQLLAQKKGWYIRLENPGEKVTSPVVVFNGVVYFTTYTPESGEQTAGTCDQVSGQGTARIYAVNYLGGDAAFAWSNSTDPNHNKLDRSKIIGTSIASAPVIAVLQGGPQMYIGVQGGVQKLSPNVKKNMETFFWRQLNN